MIDKWSHTALGLEGIYAIGKQWRNQAGVQGQRSIPESLFIAPVPIYHEATG